MGANDNDLSSIVFFVAVLTSSVLKEMLHRIFLVRYCVDHF